MRTRVAASIILLATTAASADPPSTPRGVWLVYPTVCIAGGAAPRSPRSELRVQLGAFDDRRHADARVAQLRRAGVSAEVWLAPDLSVDTDRLLVVTRARFATLSAARHTVAALRQHGVAAFARRFAVDRG